jgi:hypothetical protein
MSPVDKQTEAVGWDFGKIGPEGGHRASRGNPQFLPFKSMIIFVKSLLASLAAR